MSVIIKGMEMPKSCWDCGLCYNAVYCKELKVRFLDREDFEPGERRLPDCPLVPVPDHGRLIDADALFEEVYKVWGTEYDASECNSLMSFINAAPTIIPAEEEAEP